MKDNGAHGYTEGANYTTEEQYGMVSPKLKREETYLDLSKCTEEQQKHIISLLPPTTNKDYEIHDDYKYLHFIRDIWFVDYRYFHKTEITYPEFIKLFEGGDNDPTAQLQADNEELLEALEKAQNELFQFKEAFGQGSALIPKIESLIQKHKQ